MSERKRFPKMVGGDIELGNVILGRAERREGTGSEAARVLLAQIRGVSHGGTTGYRPSTYAGQYGAGGGGGHFDDYGGFGGYSGGTTYSGSHGSYGLQDTGRKFLACNGGCAYIDMSHLEMCLPEVISAYDHVAAWHGLIRLARLARHKANEGLPEGQSVEAYCNNSDGQGNSYGSHMNFLISREGYDDLLKRRLHYMLFFASYLTSSIVYTGAGKVGSENGEPDCDYQLSQRSDFLECLMGEQTTHNRPVVNTRDEALADREEFARLHIIFFDSTLCHTACFLKIGVTQIILAMIEAGYATTDLILEDPLAACHVWSHDPTLRATSKTIGGKRWTAVEMQDALFDLASGFCMRGGADGIVPHWQEILQEWGTVLQELHASDWEKLAPKLDWVLKRALVRRTIDRKGVEWDSPEAKHIDVIYSSVDKDEGLYFVMERAGATRQLIAPERIADMVMTGPSDTRAWMRAQVLSRFGESVTSVNWNSLSIKDANGDKHTLEMDDPFVYTKHTHGEIMERITSVDDLIRVLDFQKQTYTRWTGSKPGRTRIWPPSPSEKKTPATGQTQASLWEEGEEGSVENLQHTCENCGAVWQSSGFRYTYCLTCGSQRVNAEVIGRTTDEPTADEKEMDTYVCESCQYIFDSEVGEEKCPQCGDVWNLTSVSDTEDEPPDDPIHPHQCEKCGLIAMRGMSEMDCTECKALISLLTDDDMQDRELVVRCLMCDGDLKMQDDGSYAPCSACEDGEMVVKTMDGGDPERFHGQGQDEIEEPTAEAVTETGQEE